MNINSMCVPNWMPRAGGKKNAHKVARLPNAERALQMLAARSNFDFGGVVEMSMRVLPSNMLLSVEAVGFGFIN